MTPSSRLLAALLVRWLALIFQKGEKLHFHAPIGALVFVNYKSQVFSYEAIGYLERGKKTF